MHAWEAIQKVLDLIEEDLSADYTPDQLARAAALSPFYFQRLFHRLVKKPVGEYIRLRRLAKASELLKQGRGTVLDVALETGFNSHESFSRAFKAAYGVLPSEYKKNPVWLNSFVKPELLLQYTLVDEGVPLIAGDVVLEISRCTLARGQRYVGLTCHPPVDQLPMGENTGVDEMGEVWERFHREKAANPALVPAGEELGASFKGAAPEGCFTYFCGGAARTDVPPPQGYTAWSLPAGDYIVCGFEAETKSALVNDALYKALGYLYGTWLPAHGLATAAFSAERYPVLPAGGCPYMEIWVPPVPLGSAERPVLTKHGPE